MDHPAAPCYMGGKGGAGRGGGKRVFWAPREGKREDEGSAGGREEHRK